MDFYTMLSRYYDEIFPLNEAVRLLYRRKPLRGGYEPYGRRLRERQTSSGLLRKREEWMPEDFDLDPS